MPAPKKAGSGVKEKGGSAKEKAGSLVDCVVVIDGLSAKPELNGTTGTAVSFDEGKGRYNVKLDKGGSTLALKPQNLTAKK